MTEEKQPTQQQEDTIEQQPCQTQEQDIINPNTEMPIESDETDSAKQSQFSEADSAEQVQIQDLEAPELTPSAAEQEQTAAGQLDITEPVIETAPEAAGSEEQAAEDEPDDEPELIEGEFDTTLESVVEAILFASDEPVSLQKLVEIAEAGSVKTIRKAVKALNKKYRLGRFSFRIEELAGGYQMMTLSCFNPWLSKLIKVRSDNKLSPAQLETLAIVAYKQPIIRADIEAIRGVATGEVIRNLMYKGLVKIVGRAEILGRPMQYGTTKKFLDIFGLANLKDLPKIE
ncbi:MAG: SMC-Scp complex subunit ScpB, partial [Sedimentisphaerales bacterium]|nr:SMC-Scp complex subunit ScpB [Sedimentisphaerales bacterium]